MGSTSPKDLTASHWPIHRCRISLLKPFTMPRLSAHCFLIISQINSGQRQRAWPFHHLIPFHLCISKIGSQKAHCHNDSELFSLSYNYLLTRSFSCLLTLNAGVLDAGIWMVSWVEGLWPSLALR